MAKGKYAEWQTPEKLLLLQGWARDGLADEQIAHNIGINISTLYEWKKKYGDIAESLKKGKEVVDIEVENALLKRVLGYEVMEQRIEKSDNGTKVIQTMRHIPPDVTAQIFWLKNRRSDKWRDRRIETSEAENSENGVVIMPGIVPIVPDGEESEEKH